MASWKTQVLDAIHRLASEYRIVVTDKAHLELRALRETFPWIPDLPELDEDDIRELLLSLKAKDLHQRVPSTISDDFLYVFKPGFYGATVYLKVAVHEDCVVISIHEDR